MSNIFDNFERSVKDSLEGYEVPHSKEEWTAMNTMLGNSQAALRRRKIIKYSALLLGFFLLSSGVYYYESQDNSGVLGLFGIDERKSELNVELKEIEPKPSVEIPSLKKEEVALQESIVEENLVKTEETLEEKKVEKEEELASSRSKTERSSRKEKSSRTSAAVNKVSKKKKRTPEKKVYRQIYSSYNGRDEKRSVLKLDIPRPTAQFGFDNTEGCEGLVVQFQPINNDGNYEYFWSFGDKNFSNKENPSHKYEKEGNYRVSLTVKYGDDEFVKYNHPIAIVVHPNPKVDFDWKIDKSNLLTQVEFKNKSTKFSSAEWDFGDGEFIAKIDPSHTYKSIGEYRVTLDVVNEFNCSSKLTKKVVIAQKYNFTAPKLFTPNGDGRNDEFMPDGLGMIGNQFSLKIYKSSGEMIYETNDKFRPWDGKDSNGRIEDGTFIWILTIINPSGIDDVQQGAVVINR